MNKQEKTRQQNRERARRYRLKRTESGLVEVKLFVPREFVSRFRELENQAQEMNNNDN